MERPPAVPEAHQAYGRLRQAQAHDTVGHCATEFILKLLKKRLFSSPRAFADTLARHEESLRGARKQAASVRPSQRFLQQEFDRVDEDHENEDEQESATAEALHAAAQVVPSPGQEERNLLAGMRQWAQQASGTLDSKATCLIDWLNETVRPNGQWSCERVIIFTEYRATQKWLFEMLAWREARIDLQQVKTGRPLVLPLLPDVAGALSAYLLDGRPVSTNRTVFLRHCAPFEPFAAENNLATIMRDALRRVGLADRPGRRGLYLFRHTLATQLLAAGQPLKAIADVLGHASTQTTYGYVRVEVDGLRSVAISAEEVIR